MLTRMRIVNLPFERTVDRDKNRIIEGPDNRGARVHCSMNLTSLAQSMLYEHFTSFNCDMRGIIAVSYPVYVVYTGFCAVFAKAPHACSRLPGNFCNGAVFVGAAYSALGLPQTDRTQKRCRKHKQTLLRYKSCQAISSMRVALLHLCAKTAQNPV